MVWGGQLAPNRMIPFLTATSSWKYSHFKAESPNQKCKKKIAHRIFFASMVLVRLQNKKIRSAQLVLPTFHQQPQPVAKTRSFHPTQRPRWKIQPALPLSKAKPSHNSAVVIGSTWNQRGVATPKEFPNPNGVFVGKIFAWSKNPSWDFLKKKTPRFWGEQAARTKSFFWTDLRPKSSWLRFWNDRNIQNSLEFVTYSLLTSI